MYSPEFRRQAVGGAGNLHPRRGGAGHGRVPDVAAALGGQIRPERSPAQRAPADPRTPPTASSRLLSRRPGPGSSPDRDYSTRALAEATGLSQSIVSRSVRSLTVPVSTVTGGHEIILAASGFPLVIVGVRRVDAGDEDEGGGGGPSVPPRRIQRRIAGIAGAALRSAGVGRWRQRFDREHRQMPTGQLLDLLSGEGRFLVFDPLTRISRRPRCGAGITGERMR